MPQPRSERLMTMPLIAKWIRKATNLLVEPDKSAPPGDDFGLEHVLFYHGLVGSSPESSRAFKDVRADFISSVNRNNSQNLCICLKLPPLHWEDKLKKIVDEIKDKQFDALIHVLLPKNLEEAERASHDPLLHSDWQVRANAANLLAYLGAHQAIDRLAEALHDTAGSITNDSGGSQAREATGPAFCHLAQALSQLRTEVSRKALAGYTEFVGEDWIRVDAVSALSHWPLDEVSTALAAAFKVHHRFFDYQSVAAAKHHKPAHFLKALKEGEPLDEKAAVGLEIAIGLVEAFNSTFAGQVHTAAELGLPQTLSHLAQLKSNDALAIRALRLLLDWLDENAALGRGSAQADWPSPEKLTAARKHWQDWLQDETQKKQLLQDLEGFKNHNQRNSGFRHKILLAGEIKLAQAQAILIKIAEESTEFRLEAIEALYLAGDSEAAQALTNLARKLVNLDSRKLPKSAVPLSEKDPVNAEIYWQILRTLGKMPTAEALALMLEAMEDVAPDKREAAIDSAANILQRTDSQIARAGEVKQALVEALADPSASVKLAAARSCGSLGIAAAVPGLAKLVLAGETSLSRQALESLAELATAGEKEAVLTALNEAAKLERNSQKSKRIVDFIDNRIK